MTWIATSACHINGIVDGGYGSKASCEAAGGAWVLTYYAPGAQVE